jgi:hypothetical protein
MDATLAQRESFWFRSIESSESKALVAELNKQGVAPRSNGRWAIRAVKRWLIYD